jgi:hypothetical protein
LPRSFDPLVPIRHKSQLDRRYQILQRAVRIPGDGTLRLVARTGWKALPVDDELPSGNEARRIATLSHQEDCHYLWALSLEKVEPLDAHGEYVDWAHSFDVPATAEGISSFRRVVAPISFALTPPSISWVLLTMPRDDLAIILGESDIIESILGVSLRRAYADFDEQAHNEQASGRKAAARQMYAISEDLRDGFPNLAPGTELSINRAWAGWNPLSVQNGH